MLFSKPIRLRSLRKEVDQLLGWRPPKPFYVRQMERPHPGVYL
jgi:hypothetical protein